MWWSTAVLDDWRTLTKSVSDVPASGDESEESSIIERSQAVRLCLKVSRWYAWHAVVLDLKVVSYEMWLMTSCSTSSRLQVMLWTDLDCQYRRLTTSAQPQHSIPLLRWRRTIVILFKKDDRYSSSLANRVSKRVKRFYRDFRFCMGGMTEWSIRQSQLDQKWFDQKWVDKEK